MPEARIQPPAIHPSLAPVLMRPLPLALAGICSLILLACGVHTAASRSPATSLSPEVPVSASSPLEAPRAEVPRQTALLQTPRAPGEWRVVSANDPLASRIPATPREFRGLWVATVDNIDWPSSKDLTSQQQQDEAIRILDLARSLNFNAIVLQVRPTCDAIYPSTIEPWSEFLTGRSGRPPSTPYDPLRFWLDAAHARGLHLHAWINPYRARHPKTQFADAPNHASKTHPSYTKKYGDYLWLDPGEPWVQERTLSVVRDLISRYDLDGLHIDDYFYPYPQPELDFDDRASFARYQNSGGRLPRDAWRRQNVDQFVERLYREVKSLQREALVGISPFGIWRPNNPAGVKGMDPYAQLHADSRRWLQEGWLDYLAPQLYWPVTSKGQPFEPILRWWVAQNKQRRHIFPGLYSSRVASKETTPWDAIEIARQVDTTRGVPGAGGTIHFSAVALLENRAGLLEVIRRLYATPALVPTTPWLDAVPPAALSVGALATGDSLSITITPTSAEKPFRYIVAREHAPGQWRCVMVGGDTPLITLPLRESDGSLVRRIVVSAADTLGNESPRVVLAP